MSDNWPENVFFLEIGKITLFFHIFGFEIGGGRRCICLSGVVMPSVVSV